VPTATAPAPTPAPPPAPPNAGTTLRRTPTRLELIDRLRGLVIALMVLDHVREYFSADALRFEATDLARTTAALFATRWVTHLCAPTFVFLAGAGADLQRAGDADRGRVARFLATRGLWLIVLELTAISFAIDFGWPFLFFQVIWAIGLGMVLLAALVWAPPAAVLALGVVIVAGHELLAPIDAAGLGALAPAWRLLLEPGPLPAPLPGAVAYPALPWFGVMCLGYGLGPLFRRPEPERRRAILSFGIGLLALFAVLRALNGYGDPAPWARQPTALFTALSFFKVSKYPPSLDFVLVTLGVALPIGLALEHGRGLVGRVLLAFGRTPLFTYLVHIYLVHGLALAAGVAAGMPARPFLRVLSDPGRLAAAGGGVGLPAVYAVWLLVVAMLYPAARWYAALKARHPGWWLRYL
jgi:uncharacterized membrane protein